MVTFRMSDRKGRSGNHTHSIHRFASKGSLVVIAVSALLTVGIATTNRQEESPQAQTVTDQTIPAQTNAANIEVIQPTTGPSIDTTTQSSTSVNVNKDQATTNVTVNGQPIPVPANGSVHKTIENPNGSVTTVDVNSQNSGDTSGTTSNTSVHSFSSSTTNSFGQQTQFTTGTNP